MKHLNIGIFLIAFATLISELSLVRVFDALFYPGISYMIISSALFGLGLSGIYASLRPPVATKSLGSRLFIYAVSLAVATFMIRPVMNVIPFDFNVLISAARDSNLPTLR